MKTRANSDKAAAASIFKLPPLRLRGTAISCWVSLDGLFVARLPREVVAALPARGWRPALAGNAHFSEDGQVLRAVHWVGLKAAVSQVLAWSRKKFKQRLVLVYRGISRETAWAGWSLMAGVFNEWSLDGKVLGYDLVKRGSASGTILGGNAVFTRLCLRPNSIANGLPADEVRQNDYTVVAYSPDLCRRLVDLAQNMASAQMFAQQDLQLIEHLARPACRPQTTIAAIIARGD